MIIKLKNIRLLDSSPFEITNAEIAVRIVKTAPTSIMRKEEYFWAKSQVILIFHRLCCTVTIKMVDPFWRKLIHESCNN